MGYRDIAKRIDPELVKLFGNLPRLPYGVIPVPAYSEKSQTTAYYEEGSLAAGRPGEFNANTYDLKSRPKWEMEALTSHEAVPGHHLQLSIAQELEGVPEWRKHDDYTAFVEGWGLYSESLGGEIGLYKDPYSKFGQLTYEIWRAIRLVVDTGMHTMGWTRQQAIDYFKANSAKAEHDIEVEIDRYIVIAGQALAYKIGELKIKELRAYAQKELGDKFDVRAFHDHVLGNGAVPLDLLEKNIKAWVAETKAGAPAKGAKRRPGSTGRARCRRRRRWWDERPPLQPGRQRLGPCLVICSCFGLAPVGALRRQGAVAEPAPGRPAGSGRRPSRGCRRGGPRRSRGRSRTGHGRAGPAGVGVPRLGQQGGGAVDRGGPPSLPLPRSTSVASWSAASSRPCRPRPAS